MGEHIFVYGSLLPHLAPDEMKNYVRQLRRVGQAVVYGRLYDLGEYPGAILDSSVKTPIVGQVFELPDDKNLLPIFDSYEEYDPTHPQDSPFVRTKAIAYLTGNTEALSCWIYVYNRDVSSVPILSGGDYAKIA